jgi:hypothetical protein
VYVPGVVVEGGVRFLGGGTGLAASFRVSGRAASHGLVRLLPDGTIIGRLGGRRFHLHAPGLAAASGAAGAPSPAATVSRLRRLLERERGGRPDFGRPPRGFG